MKINSSRTFSQQTFEERRIKRIWPEDLLDEA
jgi:hypothetical protein